MPMENQLLAHLSLRLAKQHELIATEGLTYVVQNSDSCRRALERLARSFGCNIPTIDYYESEVSGDNGERPDIIGFSIERQETLIIEGKFETGLTGNQPGNYLKRLPRSAPGLLMFVVPEHRIRNLWHVVSQGAAKDFPVADVTRLPDGSVCASIGHHQRLSMISWQGVLNHLLTSARSASDPICSDLLQLVSFCSKMEDEAFKPFHLEELTSTSMARRHLDLCRIVDEITDNLVKEKLVSVNRLRATPQRDGYVRYIYLGESYDVGGAAIRLDYSAWLKKETSPIWIESATNTTTLLRPIFNRIASEQSLVVHDKASTVMLPIVIDAGKELPEIIEDAMHLVRKISDSLGV